MCILNGSLYVYTILSIFQKIPLCPFQVNTLPNWLLFPEVSSIIIIYLPLFLYFMSTESYIIDSSVSTLFCSTNACEIYSWCYTYQWFFYCTAEHYLTLLIYHNLFSPSPVWIVSSLGLMLKLLETFSYITFGGHILLSPLGCEPRNRDSGP